MQGRTTSEDLVPIKAGGWRLGATVGKGVLVETGGDEPGKVSSHMVIALQRAEDEKMKAGTRGAEQRRNTWARYELMSRDGTGSGGRATGWNSQQWPPCRPGAGAGHRGRRKRGRRVSEVERRGSLPRSIHHCTYGKNDTLLFNSLSFKDFFCGFCFVFF